MAKGITNCYISWRGHKFPLKKVKMLYMNELLRHPTESDMPQVFDSKGRVWPKPTKDLKIVRE